MTLLYFLTNYVTEIYSTKFELPFQSLGLTTLRIYYMGLWKRDATPLPLFISDTKLYYHRVPSWQLYRMEWWATKNDFPYNHPIYSNFLTWLVWQACKLCLIQCDTQSLMCLNKNRLYNEKWGRKLWAISTALIFGSLQIIIHPIFIL